ncbi:MAG: phosphodiesterase, partial [Woeseiales bacterium]
GLPVVCVPGNHDVRPMMETALNVAPFSYCDTIDAGDWLLIGIDSCIDDDAGGFIRDSEMQRLADILHQTSASHVAVCLHHPPLPMQSKWLDEVRLTLFGHVHQTFSAMYEGTQIIGTPSTCRQFMPGSDEFALDDKPPAYRRIELSADGTVSTELVWVTENT